MTTHESFESIAALDVLGAASCAESNDLRRHVGDCVPCRRARDEYAEAATLMALSLDPVAPPAEVREQIGPVQRRANPWWLATAATLFLALWGWRELGIRVAREEIARLQHENASLVPPVADRDVTTIRLRGQEIAPSASAKVLLVPEHRRALVFFRDLPANAPDKSYQLWIIPANAPRPMSAGVFDVTQNGEASLSIENLPVATEIKGLAVTLEPKGGVAQPTNTRFYLASS